MPFVSFFQDVIFMGENMVEKVLSVDFGELVGKAFEGFYRMDGHFEDFYFRLKLLEFSGDLPEVLMPFAASIAEGRGGFYASRGKFMRHQGKGYWQMHFEKEQRQWDKYSHPGTYFEFDGDMEMAESGLLVVKNGTVKEMRPASLQGTHLIYANYNSGRFEMSEKAD